MLGGAEAAAFLASKPVTLIFGVGKVTQQRLARDGLRTIGDLQRTGEIELMQALRRAKERGLRASRTVSMTGRSRPSARRRASRRRRPSSVTSREFRPLELRLWRLSESVSARLKASELAGKTVTLKLKTADFRIRTRAHSLIHPTQLATRIFAAGRDLLARETDGTEFRLIGIGVSALGPAGGADRADLLDRRTAEAEEAIDQLREKFGDDAVIKGLALDSED